jgi:hypothetical protein|tara:strand:+ start:8966 stop:9709 length:744 start_codon:yes stop_codon:yes gene_type:complete
MQPLTRWFVKQDPAPPAPPPASAAHRRQRVSTRDATRVVCLSGDDLSLRSWRKRGYDVLEREEAVLPLPGSIAFACALPRCCDLASAGARWWKRKRKENPDFQREVIDTLKDMEARLIATGAPYLIMTPAAPLLKKLWKAPKLTISPHEYGRYLDAATSHPAWPCAIPRQDAYRKRTYVYHGNGLVLPQRRPISPVWVEVKNKKTGKIKKVAKMFTKRKYRGAQRSAPLGFLEGVAQCNAKDMRVKV